MAALLTLRPTLLTTSLTLHFLILLLLLAITGLSTFLIQFFFLFFFSFLLFGVLFFGAALLEELPLVFLDLRHLAHVVLVIEALEGFGALDAGEGPGVAALAGAMSINLLLLEDGEAQFALKNDHGVCVCFR